jgi:hypothetical protein
MLGINDTQRIASLSAAFFYYAEYHFLNVMMTVSMLSVIIMNTECRYTECHNAECQNA